MIYSSNAVSSAIDIIDMTDPSSPKTQGTSLDIAAFGAGVQRGGKSNSKFLLLNGFKLLV
jgi:hypothetical protein